MSASSGAERGSDRGGRGSRGGSGGHAGFEGQRHPLPPHLDGPLSGSARGGFRGARGGHGGDRGGGGGSEAKAPLGDREQEFKEMRERVRQMENALFEEMEKTIREKDAELASVKAELDEIKRSRKSMEQAVAERDGQLRGFSFGGGSTSSTNVEYPELDATITAALAAAGFGAAGAGSGTRAGVIMGGSGGDGGGAPAESAGTQSVDPLKGVEPVITGRNVSGSFTLSQLGEFGASYAAANRLTPGDRVFVQIHHYSKRRITSQARRSAKMHKRLLEFQAWTEGRASSAGASGDPDDDEAEYFAPAPFAGGMKPHGHSRWGGLKEKSAIDLEEEDEEGEP
ncbi:hypothetical protein F5Y07DRAFT_405880 [Xylaria sp. FL0933]|nr:hypothetical protein F5Y07DRAFT_405880 [Xylaria sp. FL0933]